MMYNSSTNTLTTKGIEVFTAMNPTLKQSLGLTGLNAQTSFTQLVSDVSSNLYTFIKTN